MLTDGLLLIARTYAAAHGVELSTVSSRVFDDSKILPRLAEGSGSVTLARAERAIDWFRANWPATAVWPNVFISCSGGADAAVSAPPAGPHAPAPAPGGAASSDEVAA